jgi:hypothetical protein
MLLAMGADLGVCTRRFPPAQESDHLRLLSYARILL